MCIGAPSVADRLLHPSTDHSSEHFLTPFPPSATVRCGLDELAEGMLRQRVTCSRARAQRSPECPGNITLNYTFDTTARPVAKSAGAIGRTFGPTFGPTIGMTLVVAIVGALALATSFARGAGLPANVVTSTTPDDAVINQYITQAVNDLKSTDPAKQQAGRDAIVNFIAPAPQPPVPSPSFLTAYSRNLNRQLPALAKAPEMRTRLNTAVAVARIAEKIENEELAGTISEFLKDKDEPVAIWAMKAAKFVAPRGASGAKLVPQIVEATNKFPTSATVGYQALTGSATPTPAAIDSIHRLLEARTKLFANGVPPDALADTIGMRQLVDSKWWQAQNAAQQQKTIQSLTNISAAAAQRVQQNVTSDERASMAALVRQANRCVAAIATHTGKPALTKKMEDGVRGLTDAANPQLIAQQGEAIVTAVRADFPAISQPQMMPATKPSPTTK
jgi:hypothetical protein